MGVIPNTNTGEIEMALTDVREKTEIWVVLRRDGGDETQERAVAALGILDSLDQFLSEDPDPDVRVSDGLTQLRKLRETDTGYARYHIQGIAVTQEIAVSMCRDTTYLIGPLPVNVLLQHDRTEWPGLHFPLKEE